MYNELEGLFDKKKRFEDSLKYYEQDFRDLVPSLNDERKLEYIEIIENGRQNVLNELELVNAKIRLLLN